ncbi:heterokaryon incompatibility protein-domain-containing protein [Dactylonectria estremocensis]|uniref:Heterokaryon incompatibility protein-domain-containing protein n=1 Tax=Dactylonectria estremocensis TaxID=1079267 RepID=A0A9P9EYC4_9HYPO|nr:heterokaryon incompatibility protein-domain-containing protein [Dactylonectria estremocensis]
MASEYEYTALSHPKGSIRLLTIQADNQDEPLRGQLTETALEEHPKYITLSYTWGGATATKDLQLDGKRFKIRPNVFDALRRLRKNLGSFTIWIDAICINQDDLDERSAQVSIMRQIYESADRTIVYLGENSHGKKLQEFCETLYDFTSSFPALAAVVNSPFPPGSHVKDLTAFGLPGRNGPQWRAFFRLTSHVWFVRVWAFQESLVSRNCDIVDGDLVFPQARLFETITALFFELRMFQYVANLDVMKWMQVAQRCDMVLKAQHLPSPVDGRQSWSRSSLINLLRSSIGAGASDPRDFVFALLGISLEADEPTLQPDYQQDVDEIYKRVAKYMVKTGSANLLLDCALTHPPSGWPTWIPRWDAGVNDVKHTWTWTRGTTSRMHHHFRAVGDSSTKGFRCEDSYTLVGRGIVFDRIENTGYRSRFWNKNYDIENTMNLVDRIAQLTSMLAEIQHPYGTGRDAIQAIARTVVMGDRMDADTGTAAHADALAHWLPAAEARIIHDDLTPDHGKTLKSIARIRQSKDFLSLGKDPAGAKYARQFFDEVLNTSLACTPFTTSRGYLGLTTERARAGDVVVLLPGCEVPLVLRPKGDGTFNYVTTCYVQGIMLGEAWNEDDAEEIGIV